MKLLITLTLLFFFLAMPMASAQTVEYTPSTMTTCDKGTCTKTLYSGTMFVFEDGIWKPIEQARSLKGYYEIIYLEQDPDFLVSLIDFNYTNALFNMTFTGNYTEYEYEEEDDKFKVKLKFRYNNTEQEIEIEVEDEVAYIESSIPYVGNPLAFNFSFGGNSTTVILQDADTENLRDVHVRKDQPDNNYGSNVDIGLQELTAFSQRIYTTYNLLGLDENINIHESSACFFGYAQTVGDAPTAGIYHVFDHEWRANNTGELPLNETTITWNNQTCGANFDNSTHCNLTAEDSMATDGSDVWNCFNVTRMVWNETNNNDNNVSFVLKTGESSGADKSITFRSKEYGVDTTKRPYLIINYTFQSEPIWQTNQSSTQSNYNPNSQLFHFNITWNTTDTSIANISVVYIETNLTGTATNYTATNITYGDPIYNWTTTTPYGAGQYYWKSWANDTLNDVWNETDTWLFTIAQNVSNPLTLNFTVDSSTTTNAGISTTSATTVTIDGGTDFEASGTVSIYVNITKLGTLPDSRTWGIGVYDVKINTSGNENYTANGTGVTYTMTVTSGETTGGGGGGGASPFTVIVSDACNVTIVPRFGLSGSSSVGSEIAPFTVLLLNKNVTQTFTAEITGEADIYCDVRFSVIEPIPPFGSQRFVIDCTAPNGTASGNLVISSDLGCSFGVPITVSSSTGIFAEVSNVIKLFVSGEVVAALASTILNVPVWIWLIVIFGLIILFLVLR